MRKNGKRMLAMLLSAALVVSLGGMSALAAETDADTEASVDGIAQSVGETDAGDFCGGGTSRIRV